MLIAPCCLRLCWMLSMGMKNLESVKLGQQSLLVVHAESHLGKHKTY